MKSEVKALGNGAAKTIEQRGLSGAKCNGRKPLPEDGALLVDIQVPARAECLKETRRAMADVTEQLRLPADVSCDLLLAVGEACNNAVSHAKRRAWVRLTCRLAALDVASEGSALQVEIVNNGNGFLPAHDKVFAMPDPEGLSVHGRGMPLMQALMDDVQVLSRDGSTVVRLTKRLS